MQARRLSCAKRSRLHAARPSRCPSARAHSASQPTVDNFYELLDVAKTASEEDIKRQYRLLQRKHHPDIAGEQSRELSAQINVAYDVLSNRKARIQYDGIYKQAGFSATSAMHSIDGLVGPMRERAVPVSEVEIQVASKEAAIDWLQQWGTTIAFGCEVPFQAPLQADPIKDGVRIAVVSVPRGVVTVLGELYLEVDDERLQEHGVASVIVTRVSLTPDHALPAERALLKTLKNALKSKRSNHQGMQVSGFWATMLSGTLGLLPLVNMGDQDTAYDGYRIPKRCDLGTHHSH